MSEFNKLSKEILKEKDKYDVYKSKIEQETASKAIETVLTDMKMSLHNMISTHMPAIEKFNSKINHIDPISGNPRYGDNMKKRIREIHDEVHHIIDVLSTLLPAAEEKYVILKSQEPIEELIVMQPMVDAVDEVIPMIPDIIEPSIDLEKLHHEAELVRMKKRRRHDMKHKILFQFASQLQRMSTSKLSLTEALGHMLTPNNQKSAILIACDTMIDILERINLKPDDKLLRSVKPSNPIFYDRVSKVSGAEVVLIAIGFEFIFEAKDANKETNLLISSDNYDEKYPAFESILQVLSSDQERSEVEIDQLINVFITSTIHPTSSSSSITEILRFAEAVEFNLRVIMVEPVVDTSSLDGFQIWIDWFDKIKIHADSIRSFKQTLL